MTESGGLPQRMGPNSWFTQHEYKTGCGGSYPGRFLINWEKNAGVPTYHLARDARNNCGASGEEWNYPCKASGLSGDAGRPVVLR